MASQHSGDDTFPTPLLDVRGLDVQFENYGTVTQILNGVSLQVMEGERVALIGQSGSGKSVTMRAIIGTLPVPPARITSGSIRYAGTELLTLGKRERNRLKGTGISIVLQDPLLSFNPVLQIGRQMDDIIRFADVRLGKKRRRRARRELMIDTLKKVQLDDADRILEAWPMMLSGGMRQRVLIAMALLNKPRLLIADEPGTALDVTTQQEILILLNRLVSDEGLSLLLITHNLGVVREVADRVFVMEHGQIVETATRDALFDNPEHEYTKRLMGSVPPLFGDKVRQVVNESAQQTVILMTDISKHFERKRGWFGRQRDTVKAVDKVSLKINRGDIFGIAGESGSGKTTVARMLLGLHAPTAGIILLDGEPISAMTDTVQFRRRMQIVYQNPGSSLNPKRTVADLLKVPLKFSGLASRDIRLRIPELLEMVGLPQTYASKYPHELSGGQKQRVAIARALSVDPEVIVLDEPTSALDVLVQSTVIDLLLNLRNTHGLTYVFISHDLSLMRNFCNRIAVMFKGRVCEQGFTADVFAEPQHPYTKALLAAIPVISDEEASQKPVLSEADRQAVLASSTQLA